MHIIPIPQYDTESGIFPRVTPTLEQALMIISTGAPTAALPEIQDAIRKRMGGYPGEITNGLHHSEMIIPHGIAHLLYLNPQLIAPAVEAFYTRDPLALKVQYFL